MSHDRVMTGPRAITFFHVSCRPLIVCARRQHQRETSPLSNVAARPNVDGHMKPIVLWYAT